MWNSCLLLFAFSSGLVAGAFGDEPFCIPNGNCYTLNRAGLTFDEANMTCSSKGSLASIKTKQEQKEFLDSVTHFQKKGNVSSFWLGLYLPVCITSVKDLYGFVWVSGGDTTEVSGWKTIPKPSCTTNKKCVILEYNKSTSNTRPLDWKNVRCQRKLPSICRSSKSRDISETKDIQIVTPSYTDPYAKHPSFTVQNTEYTPHTEIPSFTSQVDVPCETFWKNRTFSSCTLTLSYACNATDCLCGSMNDSKELYKHRQCQDSMNMDCLQQCIKLMNISCSCDDPYTPCEGKECTSDLPGSRESPVARSTSVPGTEDDTVLDRLIIPLILGLVAFGILVMLVWGGVQMCIRKRRPKRRKSIAPVPQEASDTDSTDHSSSDEEEDDEEGEGELQDRTEEP